MAEADESDGAFLHYAPYAAVVTNVEADHLDHWASEEAYAAAFDEFAASVAPDGFLVVCVDDPGAAALAARTDRRVVTVSTTPGAADVGPADLAGVELWSPGDHYLADALLALAAGRELGFADADLARGIASYSGHQAADGAQGQRRGSAGLRLLRPPPDRDRRRPRRRARASPAPGGWSWPSSRTWSRGPGSSARRWAASSAPPTRSSCSTSTWPARPPTRP